MLSVFLPLFQDCVHLVDLAIPDSRMAGECSADMASLASWLGGIPMPGNASNGVPFSQCTSKLVDALRGTLSRSAYIGVVMHLSASLSSTAAKSWLDAAHHIKNPIRSGPGENEGKVSGDSSTSSSQPRGDDSKDGSFDGPSMLPQPQQPRPQGGRRRIKRGTGH